MLPHYNLTVLLPVSGFAEEVLAGAQVVAATCIGAADPRMAGRKFRMVVLDEATQVGFILGGQGLKRTSLWLCLINPRMSIYRHCCRPFKCSRIGRLCDSVTAMCVAVLFLSESEDCSISYRVTGEFALPHICVRVFRFAWCHRPHTCSIVCCGMLFRRTDAQQFSLKHVSQ